MTPIPLERIREILGESIPELLEREGWLLVGELRTGPIGAALSKTQVWERLEHPRVLETRLGWVHNSVTLELPHSPAQVQSSATTTL